MDEDRELYVFTDDDGNEITVQALHYFFYNGEEYVAMAEAESEDEDEAEDGCECGCDECECGCDDEMDIFFMKVNPVEGSEDEVEFVPVDDEDLMDELYDVMSAEFDEDEDEEDDEEEDEDDDNP